MPAQTSYALNSNRLSNSVACTLHHTKTLCQNSSRKPPNRPSHGVSAFGTSSASTNTNGLREAGTSRCIRSSFETLGLWAEEESGPSSMTHLRPDDPHVQLMGMMVACTRDHGWKRQQGLGIYLLHFPYAHHPFMTSSHFPGTNDCRVVKKYPMDVQEARIADLRLMAYCSEYSKDDEGFVRTLAR